mgnify:FL=1
MPAKLTFIEQEWTRQPRHLVKVDARNPLGQFAAVCIPGIGVFGTANPVAEFKVNTSVSINKTGAIWYQSGSLANAGVSLGSSSGLDLGVSSGVIECINWSTASNQMALFRTGTGPYKNGDFYIDLLNHKVRLIKSNIALILESSNSVSPNGVVRIAWSYNGTTGRTSLAVNGVLTTGISAQSFDHSGDAIVCGYDTASATGTNPSNVSLFAISPNECLDDAALIRLSLNPWQIFEPETIPLFFSTVTIGATLAKTEAADTASGVATVAITASLAVTESADTVTSAANVPLSASLAVTESNDSLSSAETVEIAASLSVTESADTVSASATIIDGVNASLSVTEGADTLSASASVPLSANLSYTESADSTAGSATVTINASATLTETGDSISGVSVVEITATASLTESSDSLSASATRVDGISASLNVTESSDTLAAVANAAIAAALSVTESGDTIASQSAIALSAALNSVESGDTVVSSVGISVTCSASLSEDGDTLTATASIISDSNTINAASMVRLAEIWARMELDATRPLSTSATQLTVGTISQDISTGGAVRTGAALVPSIDPDTMIAEVWKRLGLDPDNALTQTNTSIDVGNIHLNVSGNDTLTVQRV